MIRLACAEDKKSVMQRLVDNYDVDGVKVFEPSLNDILLSMQVTERIRRT